MSLRPKLSIGVLVCLIVFAAVLWLRLFSLSEEGLRGSRPDHMPKLSITENGAFQRLSRALQFETVSAQAKETSFDVAFTAFHDFLRQGFPMVHRTATLKQLGKHALLFSFEGTDKSLPAYVLMAHQDVVPLEAGTSKNWRHPPFSGARSDGYIWGRGTLDDKGSLLAILEALERLIQDGFRPRRTVHLAFGADEEVGGRQGAALIAQFLADENDEIAFVLDEGLAVLEGLTPGVEKPVALIGLGEKGSLTIGLSVKAKGGHSSMPPAISAPGRLAKAIAKLEANPLPASLDGVAGDMLRRLAPHMGFPLDIISANQWLTEPLIVNEFSKLPSTNALVRTTTAVTVLNAGVKSNVLAQSADAYVNFRIRPGETIDDVISHVRKTIDDPKVEIRMDEEDAQNPSPVSSDESPGYKVIKGAIASTFPEAVIAPGLVLAATDSRHFTGIAENVYRFSPTRLNAEGLSSIHGTDERIGTDNYLEMIAFYMRLVQLADDIDAS